MNKSEAISQELLASTAKNDNTTIKENVLVVYLNADAEEQISEEVTTEEIAVQNNETSTPTNRENQKVTASNGEEYSKVAEINIPKINVKYAVLSETSDALLKISPCKFWGPNPNEVGNFCIVGHNYRNSKFFSKVPKLEVGDIIELTDLSGRMLSYEVYDKYTVEPTDVSCTTQLTNGKKEVTLITCTNDSKQRVVVKATYIML